MCTQVLEGLRAEIRAADLAHTEAVAGARQGESQVWQERLQRATAASQEQVSPYSCLAISSCLWLVKRQDSQMEGLVRHDDGGWSSALGHALLLVPTYEICSQGSCMPGTEHVCEVCFISLNAYKELCR